VFGLKIDLFYVSASIGITGLMQYLNLKDKRFQSFQDSDSDEEVKLPNNLVLLIVNI
jgi:hypothetical protein